MDILIIGIKMNQLVPQAHSSFMSSYLPVILAHSHPVFLLMQYFDPSSAMERLREIQYSVLGQGTTDLPEDVETAGFKALSAFQKYVNDQTPTNYLDAKEALRVFNDNHNNQLRELVNRLEGLPSSTSELICNEETQAPTPYQIAESVCRMFLSEPNDENYQLAEKAFHALHRCEESQKINKELNEKVGENVGQYLLDYFIGTHMGDSSRQIDLEQIYLKYQRSPFRESVDRSVAVHVFKAYLGRSSKTEVDDDEVDLVEKQLLEVMKTHTINNDLIPYVDEEQQQKLMYHYAAQETRGFITPRKELKLKLERVTTQLEGLKTGDSTVALEAAKRQQARIIQELETLPKDSHELGFTREQVRACIKNVRTSFIRFLSN